MPLRRYRTQEVAGSSPASSITRKACYLPLRLTPAGRPGFISPRREVSVAVKFDQALVADPEVVRDFMEHNPPHFAAKCLRVVSVES
jgi:hypothetical protein